MYTWEIPREKMSDSSGGLSHRLKYHLQLMTKEERWEVHTGGEQVNR